MYLSSVISSCDLTAECAWLSEKVVMGLLPKRKYRQHVAIRQREGKELKHTKSERQKETVKMFYQAV